MSRTGNYKNELSERSKHTKLFGKITGVDTLGLIQDDPIYLSPDEPGGFISLSQVADKIAKLALKKLMWYIAKYILIGAAIVALSLLGVLIF